MKYHEMTKNYFFREFECGLFIENTAQLCFKTVRQVKKWDKGHNIPNECKRFMRMYKRLDLGFIDEWEGFQMFDDPLVYQQVEV